MLPFEDKRWEGLTGGYGTPFDPRPVLRDLRSGSDCESAWAELWEELHHQGDLGEASYAALPHVVDIQAKATTVDWNSYALISTIEVERHRRSNPAMPAWLADSYRTAWARVVENGTRDLRKTTNRTAIGAILGALALAKGQVKLGAFIAQSDASEVDELLEERDAWSELYSDEETPE